VQCLPWKRTESIGYLQVAVAEHMQLAATIVDCAVTGAKLPRQSGNQEKNVECGVEKDEDEVKAGEKKRLWSNRGGKV